MPRIEIPPNTIIEGLRVKKTLGHGRYGDVYLAYPVDDEKEKNPVCLKFCKSVEEAEKETELGYRYFEKRESIFPGELAMPSSKKIINYEKGFITVIPYINGFTLESLLRNNKFEKIDDWLEIAHATLEQIIIDKSVSQLHRDTHTENIMVFKNHTTQKLSVALIDFGLATDTNVDPKALSYRPVFDAILKFGFLSKLAMSSDRYARRIAPEHQTISSTSSVGFRSESFSVGYLFSEIVTKIDNIIHMKQDSPTKEQQEKIEKLRIAMKEMRNPDTMERMSLEEAYLTLVPDEAGALNDLNHLMGTSAGRR